MSEASATLDELLAEPPGARSVRRLPRQLRRALTLVWASAPRQLVVVAVLQLLSGLGAAAQVLLARDLLAVVLGEHGKLTLGRALPTILALGLVTLGVRLAGSISNEVTRLMSGLVERRAIAEVADAAARADLVDYERPSFHNRLQRAQLSATTRPAQMVTAMTVSLGAITGIAGIGGALIVLEPLLLALLALGAIPVWLASRRAGRALYRFYVAQTERDRMRNYIFILLSHRDWATEVRAFSLSRFLEDRLDALYDARLRDMRKLVRERVGIGVVGSVLAGGLSVATMALLVWLVVHGRLPLSAAGAAAGAVVLLGERMHGLAGGSSSLYEHSLYMEDFSRFVETQAGAGRPPTVAPLPPFESLQVRDVRFRYPSRSTPALDGVNLDIGRGEVVALVGENGSGKTTLAKVLAGLYRPDAGSLRWDDTEVCDVEPERVRRAVAPIFQEFGKYLMTAGENIAVGDVTRPPDAGRIARAAAMAGADRFVEDLPEGYDNLLGSGYYGGANLSLGQWQRIALARAYYRDAPFVILDEPTASLDPRAEAALFANIRSLYAGRSVLLISHRFGSARSADRIYVLEAGRVVEQGTHDELMGADGRYAELFRLQATAYGLAEGEPGTN